MKHIFAETRKAQELSPAGMGKALGVTRQAVYLYEDGRREPTDERLAAWLRADGTWVARLALRCIAYRLNTVMNGE